MALVSMYACTNKLAHVCVHTICMRAFKSLWKIGIKSKIILQTIFQHEFHQLCGYFCSCGVG